MGFEKNASKNCIHFKFFEVKVHLSFDIQKTAPTGNYQIWGSLVCDI